MAFFEFGQLDIYYEIFGQGEPLLLLHGNSVSSRMFSSVLPLYSKNFKVILFDFPGHGKSSRIEQFENDFWYYNAEVAYALLEELDLEKVNAIGTSGGALAGINLALEHPAKVNCLVADSFEGEVPLDPFIKTIKEDREKDKKDPLARDFWMDMHGPDWESVVDSDTAVNIAFAKSGKSFFHQSISKLQVPTLLMGSMQDEFCHHLDEIYLDLLSKNPDLKIQLFKEGTHPAMLSNANEFFELARKHFTTHHK